ncbi:MAG: GTP-binding protein [Candidatus Helarchaeota archaeon]|nr:GTP-binding protein [Candidatus Helarchaeota archaeon]
MESNKKTFRYKLILFGNIAVGKTSLVERFIHDRFNETYITTLGYNVFEKQIVHDNNILSLMIYDIGGQEKFRELREKYANGADMAFIIYDVTDRNSFNAVPDWKKDLFEFAGEIPFIIIGNKIDLEHKIPEGDAMKLSYEINALDFFETSAKTGQGVENAFNLLAIKTYESMSK